MPNVPNKLIVHHTASAYHGSQFDSVNAYHKEREFYLSSLGFYVGYHYFIEKDGSLRQAKEDHEEGCHTIGQNLQSIGICLAGKFNVELPTWPQINTLGKLMQTLLQQHQIAVTEIYPHRKFQSKDCYGTLLHDLWARCVYIYSVLQGFTGLDPAIANAGKSLVLRAMWVPPTNPLT